jgi:hypothetical protein
MSNVENKKLTAIRLPPAADEISTSLFAALQTRKTTREINAKQLPPQMLSNLVWAACGVNRKSGPFGGLGLTAASASNSQESDLCVALKDESLDGHLRHEHGKAAPICRMAWSIRSCRFASLWRPGRNSTNADGRVSV